MFRRRALRRRLAAAGAPSVPDDQLRRLARALDAGPAATECVPADPHLRLAAMRAHTFPDVRDLAELRRTPHCTDTHCCNPHHWSRLCKPDIPPPPYSEFDMDDMKLKEHGESTEDARRTDHERLASGSLATDGEEKPTWETEWCRLAYWELSARVGRQFGVRVRTVDVFGGGARASGRLGLCLDALESKDTPQPEQVRKTRSKIGLGVTLSREADGVWVYNRSQEPVFVSSPALDAAAAKALLVWRVAPAHCLRVFEPSRPPPTPPAKAPLGPVDPRSVRISFAKGWGPKYSRRDVTACPCWLEVLLAPPS